MQGVRWLWNGEKCGPLAQLYPSHAPCPEQRLALRRTCANMVIPEPQKPDLGEARCVELEHAPSPMSIPDFFPTSRWTQI